MSDFWKGLVVGGVVGYGIKWVLDYVRAEFERAGLIALTVHVAYPGLQPPSCYFVRVVNHSPSSSVELKDVWFESTPKTSVLNPERPMPSSLGPGAMWETWIPVSDVPTPDARAAFKQARVRLSTGQVIKSRGETPPSDLAPGIGAIAGRRD